MKVADLEGVMLDYWVGKAERIVPASLRIAQPQNVCEWREPHSGTWRRWTPATKWAQGGPLIERERITFAQSGLRWSEEKQDLEAIVPPLYVAAIGRDGRIVGEGRGLTHLVAAMRAYVASKFGEEVPEVSL
ncbi:phage protein NinX family protein [Cupriavidus sp. YAF13]|uniref:phage protein NinX family protein n=1 Tax=Cupriavidus sp. YAF13 TaxID=3233075 RepID=UPI003F91A21D